MRVVRRICWARTGTEGETIADVTIEVVIGPETTSARLTSADAPPPTSLIDAARVAAASYPGAAAEAGFVEESVDDRAASRVGYLLKTRRGAVVVGAPAPGGAEVGAVAPDWPVVLGPSAVLGLVRHCAETAPARVRRELAHAVAIDDRARSPYPPHNSAAPGPWGRPELFGRPFGALASDAFAGIDVRSNGMAVRVVGQALFIESLTPLAADESPLEWEGYAAFGDGARMVEVDRPVRVALDAWATLSSAGGAIGPDAMAMADDAISGPRFGHAPSLATVLRAGDVMEPSR